MRDAGTANIDPNAAPHISNAEEQEIEAAYWSFDTERRETGSERDAFKGQMRRAILREKRRAAKS